jgi:2-dehydropantoate 2-reductase
MTTLYLPFIAPKRVCVVGAGAIGGLLGLRLSQRGHFVTFHARGPHLAAMQAANALKLIAPDGIESQSAPGATFVAFLEDLPPQDYIIVGLKTHQISAVLPGLQAMLAANSDATLLATQNGVPWWFFQVFDGPEQLRDRSLESVDPGATLYSAIDPTRIVATVVYPAAHIKAPGIVQHTDGLRFPVGELSGNVHSSRITCLSEMLIDAGFKSPILPSIRSEMWLKLWGSVAVNPLSALTHATLVDLCTFPKCRVVIEAMMLEVEDVARAVGITMRVPLKRRLDGAAEVGKHKTSTLQDVEAGRPMEIDSIMGAVIEIARLTNTSTPHVDAIYGTVSMLAQVLDKNSARLSLTSHTSRLLQL